MATANLDFSAKNQWLWGQDDTSEQNVWRYFRRTFTGPTTGVAATLLITADSRYELYVNGERLGRGPARGFPFHYYYDLYDLTPYLKPGQANVLAVLANHLGDPTFGYIVGRPGFLCELQLRNEEQTTLVLSDEAWRTKRCDAFSQAVPRISLQLEFEEQFDARLEASGWQTLDYDDSDWDEATLQGAYSAEPWGDLYPRPVPQLTDDVVSAVEVKAAELARIKKGTLHYLDLRKLTGATDLGMSAGVPGKRGRIVFSELTVERACTLTVYTFGNYEHIRLRVNDEVFGDEPEQPDVTEGWRVELHAGRNLLMTRDVQWPAFLFVCEETFTVSAEHLLPGADWVFLGDLDENSGETERYWDVPNLEAVDRRAAWLPVRVDRDYIDVALLTATQDFYASPQGFCSYDITRATPRPLLGTNRELINAPPALLHDDATWTTLYPQEDVDVHLVIDFGRELIGYLRLDLEASEGTILDLNFFEGVDDGGLFFMSRTRNSFRYTCRAGRQTFTSHQRRGFRYLSLTVRQLTAPLNIRYLSAHLSTYPVTQTGHFACSDDALTKIWEVAAYTVQLCMLDTYVDCPAYEQAYWVGDARNSALVNAVAFGAFDLTEHCVRLAGQSLSDEMRVVKPAHLERPHLVTSHVVSGWFNEIPMWTFLWVWMAWEHYLYTGEASALHDYYADVRECLGRCEAFLSPRDLFAIPDVWNLVDWAAQDLEPYGEVVSNTVLFAQSCRVAAQMAKKLDHLGDAEHFTALGKRLDRAVNVYGWSETHQGYVDTVRDEEAFAAYRARCAENGTTPDSREDFQAKTRISEPTNTLALLCGAVPAERREAVLEFVLAAKDGKFVGTSPEFARYGSTDDIVPVGSPWFLFFTLETLFNEGYAEDAMTILKAQWQRMLDKGATTFWETFPGTLGGGHWSRSLCHGWSAAPAYFLSTQVLGVTPTAPGYRKVRIAPRAFHLSWARGQVPTPLGPIYVAWELGEDGKLKLEYDAPAACEVEISYG